MVFLILMKIHVLFIAENDVRSALNFKIVLLVLVQFESKTPLY
jgi:hypothetical protein